MAAIVPGWNSVEAAAKWHRGFEIAGFVALALLLFEILSYVYGNRKDTLLRVEQKRSSDRQQQHDAQIEADREQERSDLGKKVEEARKDADEARRSTRATQQHVKALEHWTLTDKQKTALVESLRKTPGLKTWVSNNLGDNLAEEYAQQFVQVLRDCGWDVDYGQGDSGTVPSG